MIFQTMAIELFSNVIGYSAIPLLAHLLVPGLSIYEFNLAATYPLSPHHAVGAELAFADASYRRPNAQQDNFSLSGWGGGPLYRFYPTGQMDSGLVLGLRMPWKGLSSHLTPTTDNPGEFQIQIIQILSEISYRFKLESITFTPGLFLGYRFLFVSDEIILGSQTEPIPNHAQLNSFLSGIGVGIQAGLGYVF